MTRPPSDRRDARDEPGRARVRGLQGAPPPPPPRPGSVALSPLCATAHPLHARCTNIFGASISETTMRSNPTRRSDRVGANNTRRRHTVQKRKASPAQRSRAAKRRQAAEAAVRPRQPPSPRGPQLADCPPTAPTTCVAVMPAALTDCRLLMRRVRVARLHRRRRTPRPSMRRTATGPPPPPTAMPNGSEVLPCPAHTRRSGSRGLPDGWPAHRVG
jgi:hypothetical protein